MKNKTKKTNDNKTKKRINKNMIIAEVIKKYPKSARIMLSYGLHCIGCHVSANESIEEGCKAHGMNDEIINKIITEINHVINKKIDTIDVTKEAIIRIKEIMTEDNKEDELLRIKAYKKDNMINYDMEFTKDKKDDDKEFVFKDIKIIIDKKSYDLMKGSEIDFVYTPAGYGFKIENPNK